MTDNDIVKALDCCCSHPTCRACFKCPLEFEDACRNNLQKYSLDLINRQAAEIKQKDTEIDILIRKKHTLRDEVEELQKRIVFWREDLDYRPKEIRAEAIKDFAERLKARYRELEEFECADCGYPPFHDSDIDNLVIEMTEGNENEN